MKFTSSQMRTSKFENWYITNYFVKENDSLMPELSTNS